MPVDQAQQNDEDETASQELCHARDIFKDRWEITKKLGSGGFGQIYLARDKKLDATIAVKVEVAQPRDQSQLPMELQVMKRCQGQPHAMLLLGAGQHKGLNFIAMQLVGQNLGNLKRKCPLDPRRYSINTTLRLLVQCLEAVRDLHSVDVLHRDIKPDLGRKDDIVSLFYVMVEFWKGALPWRDLKTHSEVLESKITNSMNKQAAELHPQIVRFTGYLEKLKYSDQPAYSFLLALLDYILKSKKYKYTDPWDWENSFQYLLDEQRPTR